MRVDAPNLRMKIGLLLSIHVKASVIAGLLTNQDNPETTLGTAALSRAQTEERFPAAYVPDFLRLFGLRPPLDLHPKNPQHSPWFDALAEPDVDAFIARVRLLGGEVPGATPAGSRWRQFLHQHRERADELGRKHIGIRRYDKPLALDAFGYRAVQPDSWAINLTRREPGLVLNAGERISWNITTSELVAPKAHGQIHMLALYDAVVDGKRYYVPVAAGITQHHDVHIPPQPTRSNALVVDSGWDERALVVVVSAEQPEALVVEDTEMDGPLLGERLDLLAVQLEQAERRAPRSYSLLRLNYRVNQGGQGLAA